MAKYKVVITDIYYESRAKERQILSALGDDIELVDLTEIQAGGMTDPTDFLPYAKDCDAIICQYARFSAEVIDQLEKCKVIARYAIGVDTIDIDAATKKGIYVANVPDYCIEEVADMACAHLLNAFRKITFARDALFKQAFSMDALPKTRRLSTQALGLLGFGNIARSVAVKMQRFFGKILAYDPYFDKKEDYPWVEFISLDELYARSDAISIHIPLNPSTHNMIDKSAIDKMRPGVVLVNTARGGIIDQAALADALDNGKIACAGLDVLSTEDFQGSEMLYKENVILTPHISWRSIEAQEEIQCKVANNVLSTFIAGKPVYPVNQL